MNWCSIKHKWERKKEDIVYERSPVYPYIKLNNPMSMSTEVRICKRCHKKQRMGIRGHYWIDWTLTKEEEREIRLKELGI